MGADSIVLLRSVIDTASTVGLATHVDLDDPIAWLKQMESDPLKLEFLRMNPSMRLWYELEKKQVGHSSDLETGEPARNILTDCQKPKRETPLEIARRSIPSCPKTFDRDGIVTCAGGSLTVSAWVQFSVVRLIHKSCLPIQCFYLERECDGDFESFMRMSEKRYEVEFVSAESLGFVGHDYVNVRFRDREDYKPGAVTGFASKSFAIMKSRFARALWLDADNYPLIDPAKFFLWPEFKRSGLVLWQDLQGTHLFPDWEGLGFVDTHPNTYESGQAIVNKLSCWGAVWMYHWMSSHPEVFFANSWGEKELFAAGAMHAMCGFESPDKKPEFVNGTALIQHGFDGAPVLCHRAGPLGKWGWGHNTQAGPWHTECQGFVDGLRDGLREVTKRPATPVFGMRRKRELEQRARSRVARLAMNDGIIAVRILEDRLCFIDSQDKNVMETLHRDGFWESWITRFVLDTIQPEWSCVDVGANVGYYTLLMAPRCASVVAIEPQKHLAALLNRSVVANGMGNVIVHNLAAGCRSGVAAMKSDPTSSMTAQVIDQVPDYRRIAVQQQTLDELIPGHVDFVKIDAEGSEERIWSGMQRHVQGGARVLMEWNYIRYKDAAGFLDRLKDASGELRHINFDGKPERIKSEILLSTDREFMLWISKEE